MSDPALLALGCGVSFLAIGGAYLALRERLLSRDEESRRELPRDAALVPVRVRRPARERAVRRAGR